MKEQTARTVIRIYGIFLWVIGLVLLETAFGFLALDRSEITRLLFIDERIATAVMIIVGLFLILFGFEVQRYRPWTRYGSVVLGFCIIACGIYFIIACENTCTTLLAGLPLNIFRILVGVFVIWFFTQDVVERLFTTSAASQTKTPSRKKR